MVQPTFAARIVCALQIIGAAEAIRAAICYVERIFDTVHADDSRCPASRQEADRSRGAGSPRGLVQSLRLPWEEIPREYAGTDTEVSARAV